MTVTVVPEGPETGDRTMIGEEVWGQNIVVKGRFSPKVVPQVGVRQIVPCTSKKTGVIVTPAVFEKSGIVNCSMNQKVLECPGVS